MAFKVDRAHKKPILVELPAIAHPTKAGVASWIPTALIKKF